MKFLQKTQRTVMFLLKVLLFFILFATFFVFFGIENEWLLRLSRTANVTMLTFAVLGSALMSIYGGYSVGVTKSKPIIYSMTLSTVFTDIVTHLQLCIMNTNAANNQKFQYEHPLLFTACYGHSDTRYYIFRILRKFRILFNKLSRKMLCYNDFKVFVKQHRP